MDQTIIDQTFTFEDARKIAGLATQLGRDFESIMRFGYPGINFKERYEEMRQYKTIFVPVVEEIVNKLRERKDRSTWGLEEYLSQA